jgi:hypothetical protein
LGTKATEANMRCRQSEAPKEGRDPSSHPTREEDDR